MNFPKLSIILITKNGGEMFVEVLARLFDCKGIDEAEVLVIDSGSKDLTLEYAKRYPQIRLFEIKPSDFGHGKTRNLAASLAGGDILVYLVQDATPATRDFLRHLVLPFSDSQVAAVYGHQLPRSSSNPVERFFLKATYPDVPQTRSYDGAGPIEIRSIFFSNVASAVRRTLWEKIPFDEELIMSEDQKWAEQVLRAGYCIVYESAAAVYHSHNYGLRKVFQRNFDSGVSLRGLIDDSLQQMAGYEIRYLWAGIRQLALRGDLKWMPYFLLKEAIRSLGFFLGQRSHLLPVRVNRKLSMHKFYWNKYEKKVLHKPPSLSR